jgi:Putative Ig domain
MRKIILVAIASLCFAIPAFAQCETSTLTFTTESLPGFFLDQPANFQIQAVGGTTPYHFELVEGSALPAGLHMNAHGRITGKPQELTFDTTIFVRVTDAQGCTLVQAFPVYVEPSPV